MASFEAPTTEYGSTTSSRQAKAYVWNSATRDIAGGICAGVANAGSGYPFDTMKVRLQAGHRQYQGMTDVFSHIWKTQGVRGFYKGLSSPLLGVAAENAVSFTIFSQTLQYLQPEIQPHLDGPQHGQPHQQQQHQQQQQQLPPLSAVPIAGAAAGFVLPFILSPTELVKCRMQMAQHPSPAHCLSHILATEGLRGLTRGFLPTLWREVPGNAIFFTTYEGLRRMWPVRRTAEATPSSSGSGAESSSSSSSSSGLAAALEWVLDAGGAVVCGGLAGMAMWTIVLPLDVAKTRIQTAKPGSPMDTSVLRQLQLLWREGGRRRLWAGYGPTLARALPANACQWLAWEAAMRHLPPAGAGDAGQA